MQSWRVTHITTDWYTPKGPARYTNAAVLGYDDKCCFEGTYATELSVYNCKYYTVNNLLGFINEWPSVRLRSRVVSVFVASYIGSTLQEHQETIDLNPSVLIIHVPWFPFPTIQGTTTSVTVLTLFLLYILTLSVDWSDNWCWTVRFVTYISLTLVTMGTWPL